MADGPIGALLMNMTHFGGWLMDAVHIDCLLAFFVHKYVSN